MIDDLLFFSMAPRMIMHVSLGSEAFLALIAYERPLIVVNPFVNPQVLLLRKTLATRRRSAAEGLSTVVDMLVGLQSNVALEDLPTAYVRANKQSSGFDLAPFLNL